MTEITAPQSEVVLVEAAGEIVAIVPQPQAVVIEVRRGPAGPAGPDLGGIAFPETANATTRAAITAANGQGCFQLDTLEAYVCTVAG